MAMNETESRWSQLEFHELELPSMQRAAALLEQAGMLFETDEFAKYIESSRRVDGEGAKTIMKRSLSLASYRMTGTNQIGPIRFTLEQKYDNGSPTGVIRFQNENLRADLLPTGELMSQDSQVLTDKEIATILRTLGNSDDIQTDPPEAYRYQRGISVIPEALGHKSPVLDSFARKAISYCMRNYLKPTLPPWANLE